MPSRSPSAVIPTLQELYPAPYDSVTRRHIIPVLGTKNGALLRDIEQGPNSGWDALRSAAEAQCSPERELVLLTTDSHHLDIAVNLVANLAAVGVHNYLVLADRRETCMRLKDKLACVWSTLILPRFQKKLMEAMTNNVRAQWLVRQIYVGRLAAMGFSPMLLDADIVLFANPFELIRKHLPSYQLYFLGDTSAGWLSINGGTIFIRNASAHGPTVRIWRELERRTFALLNTTAPYPKQLRHKTPRGFIIDGIAADALLYDQNMLDCAYMPQRIIRDPATLPHALLRAHAPASAPTPGLL